MEFGLFSNGERPEKHHRFCMLLLVPRHYVCLPLTSVHRTFEPINVKSHQLGLSLSHIYHVYHNIAMTMYYNHSIVYFELQYSFMIGFPVVKSSGAKELCAALSIGLPLFAIVVGCVEYVYDFVYACRPKMYSECAYFILI